MVPSRKTGRLIEPADTLLLRKLSPANSGVYLKAVPEIEIRDSTPPVDLERLATRNKILAAGIHDVNNLLTVMLPLCQALEDGIVNGIITDPEVKELAAGVTGAVTRTMAISTQCMFANNALDNEKPAMSPISLNLFKFLGDIQDQVNIPLTLINPKHCKELYADPNHFSRVIVNLLNNVKYHSKKPNATTEIIVDESDSFQIIQVRDRGIGLPEDMTHLFEFNTQADGLPRGFGVGLAACRLVCEAHGGYIRAENNQDGPGATFTVGLPKKGV